MKPIVSGGASVAKIENRTIDNTFNEMYNLYKESIFSFCMAKLNCNVDAAEDCTQETFIILYKKLKDGVIIENARAFLYRTALNYIRRYMDKRKKEMLNEISLEDKSNTYVADRGNPVDAEYNYKQLQNKLESILTDEEKELFELRFYCDMKIEDIAKHLGIKPTACATRICRMRTKIKNEIKDFV